VLLHVAGALQHHLIRKDGVLRRMLSPTAPLPELRR
jgi:cytochrome b561